MIQDTLVPTHVSAPAAPRSSPGETAVASSAEPLATLQLRLRRLAASGPRCPDCAGPLVFGEGCRLCPVCGYSTCGGGR